MYVLSSIAQFWEENFISTNILSYSRWLVQKLVIFGDKEPGIYLREEMMQLKSNVNVCNFLL